MVNENYLTFETEVQSDINHKNSVKNNELGDEDNLVIQYNKFLTQEYK